jgi:hypothetical protein
VVEKATERQGKSKMQQHQICRILPCMISRAVFDVFKNVKLVNRQLRISRYCVALFLGSFGVATEDIRLLRR